MTSTYFRLESCVLIMLTCMLAVSSAASANAIGDADRRLFNYIHDDMQSKFFDKTMPTITRMGDSRPYGIIFMALCAMGNEKMAETGKLAASAFLIGAPIGSILRRTIRRPRPLNPEDKVSLPSGHVILSTNIAIIVGHEYPVLKIPLYILGAGAAFSRIYLGRHYPSDVLAGMAIGALTSIMLLRYREPVLGFRF